MNPLDPKIALLLTALVVTAAVFDIRYRRIPNWLNVSGLAAGFLGNLYLHHYAGLRASVQGFGLAFVIYFILFILHAKGAGDVKLMAAVGAISGPWNWFVIFMIASILGGVAALVLALSKKRLANTLWNVRFIVTEMAHVRAPFVTREEVDVNSPKSLRLPGGAIVAVSTLLFIGWNLL